jgi:RimJ/RimL family protein N-acetyltransferase
MVSFQEALSLGQLVLRRCEFEPALFVHSDEPVPGVRRLTYVHLDNGKVEAFVTFVLVEPFDGLPCFQLGYAVPPALRNQGRAKAVVSAAIKEMERGFARANIPTFYIEAVIGADNVRSRRVAEAITSNTPTEITDNVSGQPALQFIFKVGASL